MLQDLPDTSSFPLTMDDNFEWAPQMFSICKLEKVEGDTLYLQCPRWPTSITADGCGVNILASELLKEDWGLHSPFTRCAAHRADGSLKRIAKSKTHCVAEVVETHNALKPIVGSFKHSSLHLDQLNESMSVFGFTRVKTLNWCAVRQSAGTNVFQQYYINQ